MLWTPKQQTIINRFIQEIKQIEWLKNTGIPSEKYWVVDTVWEACDTYGKEMLEVWGYNTEKIETQALQKLNDEQINAVFEAVSLAIGMSYKREGREVEHYNSQAALFGQSVTEMLRLLELCGGHPSNVRLLSGDLYVTVFGGRTRKIGTLLGTGMSFAEAMEKLSGVTLESIVIATRTAEAIRTLIAAGRVRAEEFPLLLHVDELINQGKKLAVPWKAFETEFELAGEKK